MLYILYFASRKNFKDQSTWAKEVAPADYTLEEIREVSKLADKEGFAIWNATQRKTVHMEWFVEA